MAQGNNRNQIYQEQNMQQLLNNRNIYQQEQHQRVLAPATAPRTPYTTPYIRAKTNATSVYAAGTTLASNNPAVVRRNARERNRVKQVNNGFVYLRQHIPTAIIADLSNGRRGIGPGANKKLSKVDTLRMAVEYIRRLQHVIDEVDQSDASSVSSYNSYSSSGGSPPPPLTYMKRDNYYAQQQHEIEQRYYSLSYAGSFPTQNQQESEAMLVSPAVSTNSSNYSTADAFSDSTANNNVTRNSVSLKYEQPSYDEYTNTSTDDEELLDYISLWQEDL